MIKLMAKARDFDFSKNTIGDLFRESEALDKKGIVCRKEGKDVVCDVTLKMKDKALEELEWLKNV